MPLCCINKHINATGIIWCTACESLVAGVRIDDYVIVSYIRRGSSSAIYLAHSLNNRKVVLKVFQSISSRANVDDFQREAALLASLKHPSILPIYGYGVIRERRLDNAPYTPYLVLPYAGQGSLDEVFLREGRQPWSIDRVLPIIEEAAAALSYAHERGVLHRDVKPANLLLMGSHVLLSDFGVSSLINAEESHLSITMAGSPAFMAPEVWECRPGRYSDQYALAVTCFYLLMGDYLWPHTGNTNMHAWSHLHRHIAPRSLRACRPDLSMEVSMVLQRALAKDPHGRYPSLSMFASDLKAAMLDTTLDVSWEVLRNQSIPSIQSLPQVHSVPQADYMTHRPLLAGPPAVAAPVTPAPAANFQQVSARPGTYPPNNVQLPVTPVPQPAIGRTYKDRWTKQALALNVLVCLLFAIMAYGQNRNLSEALLLVRALLPGLIVGPCVALWFRHRVLVSTTKGVLYGVCFGCIDTLFSALTCFVWEALWRTFALPWGHWSTLAQGLSFFASKGSELIAVASIMAPICLGFTILGGAIIGLLAIQSDD